jgi:hypothetical protein
MHARRRSLKLAAPGMAPEEPPKVSRTPHTLTVDCEDPPDLNEHLGSTALQTYTI